MQSFAPSVCLLHLGLTYCCAALSSLCRTQLAQLHSPRSTSLDSLCSLRSRRSPHSHWIYLYICYDITVSVSDLLLPALPQFLVITLSVVMYTNAICLLCMSGVAASVAAGTSAMAAMAAMARWPLDWVSARQRCTPEHGWVYGLRRSTRLGRQPVRGLAAPHQAAQDLSRSLQLTMRKHLKLASRCALRSLTAPSPATPSGPACRPSSSVRATSRYPDPARTAGSWPRGCHDPAVPRGRRTAPPRLDAC